MNKEKMGLFLSELRKERNLTLQDAGEIFLVSFQAISKWERGESVPDVAILEQLAKFYNVSIEEIINGERKVKEVKEEKIEEKDERISTEQKKNRIKLLDILFGSLFLLFIFFIGLFVQVEFETVIAQSPFHSTTILVQANMYKLIFSSSYEIGNGFLTLSLVCFIVSTIFCILCGTCLKNGKSGYLCRRIFAYASFTFSLIYLLIAYQIFTSGAIIYVFYIYAYMLLVLCLPQFQEEGKNYIVPKKMRKAYIISTYVYLVIGVLIVLSGVLRDHIFQIIILLAIGVLSINEIAQRGRLENRILYLCAMIVPLLLSMIYGYSFSDVDMFYQTTTFLVYDLIYIVFFAVYMSIFRKKQEA